MFLVNCFDFNFIHPFSSDEGVAVKKEATTDSEVSAILQDKKSDSNSRKSSISSIKSILKVQAEIFEDYVASRKSSSSSDGNLIF